MRLFNLILAGVSGVAVTRPGDAVTRPANAVTRPANAVTRPANAVTRPATFSIFFRLHIPNFDRFFGFFSLCHFILPSYLFGLFCRCVVSVTPNGN